MATHCIRYTVMSHVEGFHMPLSASVDLPVQDPVYLQSVIIHSVNGGKVLRMACRRVLSSILL
jgi:hypothetical protein